MEIHNKIVEEFRRLLEREAFEQSLDLSPGVRIRAISQKSNDVQLNALDNINQRQKKDDHSGVQKEKLFQEGLEGKKQVLEISR
jgi:hypothetical protein